MRFIVHHPFATKARKHESQVVSCFRVFVADRQCQRLCLFRWSAMYSAVRIASARIVHVTFLSALVTNGPPSAMNRFFTSWAWQYLFTTDVFGSSPILVVPTS